MLREARQAYVIYGIEPGLDFADQGVAMRALAGAKTIAFSHYACRSTRSVADVILPIALLPELDASLTNMDGFEQRTQAAGKMRGSHV